MRVFLTGATGVVGRRLVPLLIRQGHLVTAVVRSPEKKAAVARAGATPAAVGLFDRNALDAAVRRHDAVVNLATHIPASSWKMLRRSSWAENDRIRREGSSNLADAAIAAGVSRFVQESFAPVYPDRGDQWIDEDVPTEPVSYNRSLLDAERAAARFTASGRSGVVLRFGAFYGPDAVQLADAVRLVRRGWAPLPGRPGSYISSVSHDDAASAAASALIAAPGVYNVVDDEPVTHREYFDSLAAVIGAPRPRIPPPWTTALMGSLGKLLARSQRISNLRFRSTTDWVPKYRSVREGWPDALEELDARSPAA
jgi:nucleoside-diphosphate-sugar epimerase